jgi:hypothetical protein
MSTKKQKKFDVNRVSVMVDPNKHLGAQIRLQRETKNISVQAAADSLSALTGKKENRQQWYNQESKGDIGLRDTVLLFTALGFKNIYVDDYRTTD